MTTVKNMNALLITQYETVGTVGREEYLENFMHEMDINLNMLSDFNEFLIFNNDSPIYNMCELEEQLSSLEPVEAFSKALASVSKFSWNDDYFSYDGYDNLESYNECTIIKMMRNNTEFLKWYIEQNDLIDWDEAENDIKDANELIAMGY